MNFAATGDAVKCKSGFFFAFVPWYAYFNDNDFDSNCHIVLNVVNKDANGLAGCNAQNTSCEGINSVWLIALAVFEDLLRVAGIAAVVFVIYGGIRYTTSEGEPEHTRAALGTIINALVGLVIAMIAATTVSFIGTKLGGG